MYATFDLEVDNAQGYRAQWKGDVERVGGDLPWFRLGIHDPPDLRGIELSVQRGRDGIDTMYLYLPSIRRVRKIRADMFGESFLGTDFNYEDLGFERLEATKHAIIGDDRVDGRPCTRIESIPANPWWYSRVIRCVDLEDYVPRRTEYFDSTGRPYKVRTLGSVEMIASHPTPHLLRMEDVRDGTGTASTIRLSNVFYENVP